MQRIRKEYAKTKQKNKQKISKKYAKCQGKEARK
jgi:hypothetical protein